MGQKAVHKCEVEDVPGVWKLRRLISTGSLGCAGTSTMMVVGAGAMAFLVVLRLLLQHKPHLHVFTASLFQ